MWWLLPLAAGAIQGAMKNNRAREIESNDRNLASETARYSPWTHMSPGSIRYAGSAGGDIIGGAMAGLGTAQSMGMVGKAPETQTPDYSSGFQSQQTPAYPQYGTNYRPGMLGANTDLYNNGWSYLGK